MKTYTAYQIHEHPNPQAVYDWIRANWYDLSEHNVSEVIDSLKALAKFLGVNLSFSISSCQDQSNHIDFIYHTERVKGKVKDYKLPDLSGNCPLTGVCWDENLLDVFRNISPNTPMAECLKNTGQNALKALYDQDTYTYSDEGLKDFCIGNEYHFFENGEFAG